MGSIADYNANVWLERKGEGRDSEQLLEVSNGIYYDDSDDEDENGGKNETSQVFKITQKFIDSLKPGDVLTLTGDGNQY